MITEVLTHLYLMMGHYSLIPTNSNNGAEKIMPIEVDYYVILMLYVLIVDPSGVVSYPDAHAHIP